MTPIPWLRWAFRVVVVLVVVMLAIPVVTAARIWIVSRQDDRTSADVLLVLGAAQFNGTPSPVLESRLRHAQTLYEQKVAPKIMTLGGNQPGDRYTEASAGKAYLIEHGVPASAIITVPVGDNTLGSMTAAAKAMKRRGMSTAVVVTDPDHSLRTRTIGRDLGMSAWTSPARFNASRTSTPRGMRYVLRETGAYLDYVVFKRRGVQAVLG